MLDSWWMPLLGGVLLGASAALLMVFNGRICGISGIFRGVLTPKHPDWTWRVLFVLGMMVTPFALWQVVELPKVDFSEYSLPLLALAGLLVGVGTSLANGCTSGHGICGLSRLSKRSMVATVTFMAVAVITVAITQWIGS